MIPVPSTLADAIEAPVREPLVRVHAWWNGDSTPTPLDDLSPYVESVTVDRVAAGELPDEVSLVEGAAAASADLVLAAPDRNLAAEFNRTNPDSVLYGKELLSTPLIIEFGFRTEAGPQFVQRFTGLTRAVQASGRTVRVKALDLREHLGWPVALPVVGRLHYGLNASWVLSHVIAEGGGPQRQWHVSPTPTLAQRHLRMHGSLYPHDGPSGQYTARMIASTSYPGTTGATATDTTVEPTWVAGPFLTGCYAGPLPRSRDGAMVRGELSWNRWPAWEDHSTGRAEFWTIQRPAIAGENATGWRVAVLHQAYESTTNGLIAGVAANGTLTLAKHSGNPDAPTVLATGAAVPADGAWHYVRVEWDTTTPAGVTVQFQVDGNTTTVAGVAGFPAPTPYRVDIVRAFFRQPLAELALTAYPDLTEDNIATSWQLQTAINAVVDSSILELDLVPDLGARPAWEWLREVAAAEQAVVAIDEQGILRYRTATRLATAAAQTVAKTVTADESLLDLGLDDAIDAVKTQVSVTATVRAVAGTLAPVYTSTTVYTALPGEVLRLWLDLGREAIDLDTTPVINRPTDSAPNPAGTFVCLAFNANGSTTGNPDDEIRLGWQQTWMSYQDGRTYALNIENTTGRPVYVATAKSSVPTISLAGRAITATSVTVTRSPRYDLGPYHPVVVRHGLLPLDIPANPWVQRVEVAEALADRLMHDLYLPSAVVRDLAIVADPRLQLGDRVRLVDRDGHALDGEYWLAAIRDRFSDSQGYTQQITARRASTILRWGTGRWGENTWGVS